jgi:5-methylcytosine-specific restriction endonuclease McrA
MGKLRMYICQQCGKEFQSNKGCVTRAPKYCSRECAARSQAGRTPWNKGKHIWDTRPHPRGTLGMKGLGAGRRASAEARRKLSEAHTGLEYPTIQGEGHWNWKGGVTDKNEAVRKSAAYKRWRRAVFERDDYTCTECGKRGGRLHAHHIVPFSVDEEGRFNVDNGRTLCARCHKNTDSFGNRVVNYTAHEALSQEPATD